MTIDQLQREMTIEELEHQIRDHLPEARAAVRRFSSGTTFIDIDSGERSFIIELSARCHAVGFSELTERIPMDWSGHDEEFATLEKAAEHLFSLLQVPREGRTHRTPA